MKKAKKEKKLDPVLWALLALIIPGFIFIWIYMIKDMLKARDRSTPSIILAMILPASSIPLILSLIKYNEYLFKISGLLFLAGLVSLFIYLMALSQSAHNISRHNTPAGLIAVCLLIFPPIGVYIVQDILNKSPNKEIPSKYRKSLFE